MPRRKEEERERPHFRGWLGDGERGERERRERGERGERENIREEVGKIEWKNIFWELIVGMFRWR